MAAGSPEENRIEDRMLLAEKALEKYGARPIDINRKNREILNQRVIYLLNNVYYRVDHAEFDGKAFVILSCIEDPKYADIGLMEDVEAIPADASEEEIDRVIRQALGIGGETA